MTTSSAITTAIGISLRDEDIQLLRTTAVLVLRTFYQARADFEAVAEGTTTSPSMMAELALIGNVSSHRSLDGSGGGTIKSNAPSSWVHDNESNIPTSRIHQKDNAPSQEQSQTR